MSDKPMEPVIPVRETNYIKYIPSTDSSLDKMQLISTIENISNNAIITNGYFDHVHHTKIMKTFNSNLEEFSEDYEVGIPNTFYSLIDSQTIKWRVLRKLEVVGHHMSNKKLIITYISKTHKKEKVYTLQPVNSSQEYTGRDYKIFKLQIRKNVMVGGKKKSKKSHKKRKSKKSYKKRKSRKSKKSHKKRKSRKSISN
jgi:hypothetical protein